MTLPINKTFSPVPEFNSFQEINTYLQKIKFELEDNYQNTTQNINGFIRNDADVDGSEWTPTINSTGTSGTITYLSAHQTGWVIRQGILIQLWFDIQWSAIGGSTGNLYVDLPYKVTKSGNMPFVGVIQQGGITLSGTFRNLTINAIPSTYRGEIWQSSSGGSATTNLSIPSSGRLIGNLFYIGVEDE